MKIEGASVLVTGANRGLGRAFAAELLNCGAATVYAGARDPATVTDSGVVPVALDVTDHAALAALADRLPDVAMVINNAGVGAVGRPLTVDLDAVRAALEVNCIGLLAVSQAFAPALAAHGGGALVNILSVYSWTTIPPICGYAASKAAAWSMTDALRQQMRPHGTQVVGVHVGTIDTDMAAGVPGRKLAPAHVAREVLRAVVAGAEEVLVDEDTRRVKEGLSA